MVYDRLTGLKTVLIPVTNLLHLRTKDARESETGGHIQHFYCWKFENSSKYDLQHCVEKFNIWHKLSEIGFFYQMREL